MKLRLASWIGVYTVLSCDVFFNPLIAISSYLRYKQDSTQTGVMFEGDRKKADGVKRHARYPNASRVGL